MNCKTKFFKLVICKVRAVGAKHTYTQQFDEHASSANAGGDRSAWLHGLLVISRPHFVNLFGKQDRERNLRSRILGLRLK